MATEAPIDQLALDAVEAMNGIFGRHDGHRTAHAKGAWCEGTLTGTPAATAISRAPFLTGEPIRTLVRYSNGSGNPEAHDGHREARGMAVKLFLPDGSVTDLVTVTSVVFSSRTPEDFIELMRAARPDPDTGERDMAKIGAFLEQHPEALPSIQHALGTPPPASFLGLTYNSLHAYRWIAPDGTERFVRTRFAPHAEIASLEDDEARAKPRDYLTDDLNERLAAGPARFTLLARIAAADDPTDDPSAAWPEEREAVPVAELVIERTIDDPETPADIHVFDPTRVCDGIELSGDPVLHFRRRAYDVSARRRWSS